MDERMTKLRVDLAEFAKERHAEDAPIGPFAWVAQGTGYSTDEVEEVAKAIMMDLAKAEGDLAQIADLVMFAMVSGAFIGERKVPRVDPSPRDLSVN